VRAATAPVRVLGPAAPPSKNPDEVDIDESSEDDYGPAPQPSRPDIESSPPPTRVLEPTPPSKNPDELTINDSSEDDYGPAPQSNHSRPSSQKRILGPSLPPAPLSTMPSQPPDSSDSGSDDEYAPAPPPAPGSLAENQLLLQQQQQSSSLRTASSEEPKQRRAEWMLVPPSADSSRRADPTQIKARKFASSRGGGSAGPAEKGISAIWTETPEEKRRRLEDEVLGRVEPSTASSSASTAGRKKDSRSDREDAETERRIREYNERNRGKSLLETHNDKSKEKREEDDPSKRGFDREKDMALGGWLGHGQKREMLTRAADFGSRFQKGKYL
jgi:hypothetical protein